MRQSLATSIALLMLANAAECCLAQRLVTHEELVYAGPSLGMMSKQIGASSIEHFGTRLGGFKR